MSSMCRGCRQSVNTRSATSARVSYSSSVQRKTVLIGQILAATGKSVLLNSIICRSHKAVQHLLRRRSVGSGLHRTRGASLAQTTHGIGIAEKTCQGGMGLDYGAVAATLCASDNCPSLLEVADNVAQILVGHGDLDVHDRLQEHDARIAEPLVEGIGSGQAEGQFAGLRLVRLAAEDRHLDVHQRKAQHAATLA